MNSRILYQGEVLLLDMEINMTLQRNYQIALLPILITFLITTVQVLKKVLVLEKVEKK